MLSRTFPFRSKIQMPGETSPDVHTAPWRRPSEPTTSSVWVERTPARDVDPDSASAGTAGQVRYPDSQWPSIIPMADKTTTQRWDLSFAIPAIYQRGIAGPLLRGDERPADQRATHGAPTPEPLVDLRRDRRLLPEGQAGRLDLRIGHVPHRQPARGIRSHLTTDEAQHGVTHLRDVPEALKAVVIVRGIEPEEIGGHDCG